MNSRDIPAVTAGMPTPSTVPPAYIQPEHRHATIPLDNSVNRPTANSIATDSFGRHKHGMEAEVRRTGKV